MPGSRDGLAEVRFVIGPGRWPGDWRLTGGWGMVSDGALVYSLTVWLGVGQFLDLGRGLFDLEYHAFADSDVSDTGVGCWDRIADFGSVDQDFAVVVVVKDNKAHGGEGHLLSVDGNGLTGMAFGLGSLALRSVEVFWGNYFVDQPNGKAVRMRVGFGLAGLEQLPGFAGRAGGQGGSGGIDDGNAAGRVNELGHKEIYHFWSVGLAWPGSAAALPLDWGRVFRARAGRGGR